MKVLLKAMAIAVLCASPVFAAEDASSDTSLVREVDQYLEKSATDWEAGNTLRAFWKTGLNFESNDGKFKLKIGGRLMWDNVWRTSDEFGPDVTKGASYFRRARLYMSGTIHRKIGFKIQLDFARAVLVLKDAYISLKEIRGLGEIKMGHFKESVSLQGMTSSKYIQLMERSVVLSAFSPARNAGIQVANEILNKRMTFAIGIFQNTDDLNIDVVDGGGVGTLRLTGLAVHNEDQHILLHLGFSVSYRSLDTYRARARPGAGDKNRTVDTGNFVADSAVLLGFEVAFQWRFINVQAEYIMVDLDATASGDPTFSGFYIEVGVFVTGEIRKYKKGAWSRTSPKRNFHDGDGGLGAVQIVLRFGSLDLNDGLIAGGQQDVVTVGINWHWNPNVRVMFNWAFASVDSGPEGPGDLVAFAIRVQIDF